MGEHSAWRVPGYAVESLLGVGGSGTVWRGRSRRSGEQVALKHLPIVSADSLLDAKAEAAMLTGLSHPHLTGLREVIWLDDAVVLVLDLASRGPLATLLAARGRLTPQETITAVAPVAAALAYAHANGVVHADVSPANIVFSERGDALLTDLGLARLTGSGRRGGGTPGYVDPAAGVVPVESGDVWSLGAVAFHCLTGGVPRGDLEAALSGVPDAVAEVVLRALDPDPSQRGTAADLALELRHAATPAAVEFDAGREPGPLRPAPTRAVQVPPRPAVAVRRRPPRWIWAAVGLTLVVGLTTAVVGRVSHSKPAAVGLHTAPRSAGPVRPTSAHPASAQPAAAQPPSVAQILAGLDAVRERAYGQRRPELLARVYVAGELLSRDRARLTGEVPAGCGMTGVHTTYSDPVVTQRTTDRIAVRTTAALGPSRLTCGGSRQGSAPGTTAGLRITLIRSPDGWLIQSID